MHEIIDAATAVGAHAGRLFQEGVRIVIRYYNHRNSSVHPTKCLTKDEFVQLTAAGLEVAAVFQQRGGAGGYLDDFSHEKGDRDARRALELARTIGQPQGSAIYFAVDHDFYRPAELQQVEKYFAAVNGTFAGQFRVGVYGSGAVCSRLQTQGLATLFWLPASMGWSGSRAFLAGNRWTLFQKVQDQPAPFGGFRYDGNIMNPAAGDCGQFGGEKALPSATPAPMAGRIAVFEVQARSGLVLRGGPGTSFERLASLPNGAIVHGLGQQGDWVKVDINGDGIPDGFMAAPYLKILSGGLPLAPGATPYAVAEAELARDVRAIPGPGSNPRIVLYHSTTTGGAAGDEVAWCSSFVNYCVEQAGGIGTRSKRARSWESWGQDVSDDPRPGDIVVWRRQVGRTDGGHVAFFVEKTGDRLRVLGGNQSGRVRLSDYPEKGMAGKTKFTLLSIRR